MKKIKDLANEIFIEGLSGMATGLFATLIIGKVAAIPYGNFSIRNHGYCSDITN